MKTVWIIQEPVLGLDDDRNEAMRQAIRRQGLNAKVVPSVPFVQVQPGDIVLVHGWNPIALEVAKWRDQHAPTVRLAVYLGEPSVHDGPYQASLRDPCKPWRSLFEEAIIAAADLVAAPTAHVRGLADPEEKFGESILVVGGYVDEQVFMEVGQRNFVGWPSRTLRVLFPTDGLPCDGLDEFEQIKAAYAAKYPDDQVEWIHTDGRLDSRAELVKEMAMSRVVLSCKVSEAWPADLVTGANLGAYPVVPSRLGYPEFFGGCLYETVNDAVDRIYDALHADNRFKWPGPQLPSFAKALEEL